MSHEGRHHRSRDRRTPSARSRTAQEGFPGTPRPSTSTAVNSPPRIDCAEYRHRKTTGPSTLRSGRVIAHLLSPGDSHDVSGAASGKPAARGSNRIGRCSVLATREQWRQVLGASRRRESSSRSSRPPLRSPTPGPPGRRSPPTGSYGRAGVVASEEDKCAYPTAASVGSPTGLRSNRPGNGSSATGSVTSGPPRLVAAAARAFCQPWRSFRHGINGPPWKPPRKGP
jgi:hypothetical protein